MIFYHLLYFVTLISSLCQLPQSKLVTWLPEGGGDLQQPGNWDSNSVPTYSDDVIIDLTSSSSLTSFDVHIDVSPERLLSSDFDPLSLSSFSSFTALRLSSPWEVNSLQLRGAATLLVEQPLLVRESVTLSSYAQLRVRASSLEAMNVVVDEGSLFSLELAELHAKKIDILPSSLIFLGGPGGSNTLHELTMTIQGSMVALSGPLILSDSTVVVENSGLVLLYISVISSFEDDNRSFINNKGHLLVDSYRLQASPKLQDFSVPIHNEGSFEISSREKNSPATLILSDSLKQNGRMVVSAKRTVTITSSSLFSSVSSTALQDEAVLLLQSSNSAIAGTMESDPGSELRIQSQLNLTESSKVDVAGKLSLRTGGVIDISDGVDINVNTFLWYSGEITGHGTVSVLQKLLLLDNAMKTITNAYLSIHGEMVHEPYTTLLMKGTATLRIEVGATQKLLPHSQVLTSDGSPSIMLLENSSLILDVEGNTLQHIYDGVDSESSIIMDVLIESNSVMNIQGKGKAEMKRNVTLTELTMSDAAILLVRGKSAQQTSFTILKPLHLDFGSSFIIESASLQIITKEASKISTVSLFDAVMELSGDCRMRSLTLGSSTATSLITGDVTVEIEILDFQGGVISTSNTEITSEVIIQTSNAKLIASQNFSLFSDCNGHVRQTQLFLSPTTFWHIFPNASLTITFSSQLYPRMLNLQSDAPFDEDQEMEVIREVTSAVMFNEGTMIFHGIGEGVSGSRVMIWNSGVMVVKNDAPGVFTVTLDGGLQSKSSSLLMINGSSHLHMQTPLGVINTYGTIQGDGILTFHMKEHEVYNRLFVHDVHFRGAVTLFYNAITLNMVVQAGATVELHASMLSRNFQWSGGVLKGYPVLGSSLLVQYHSQISSDTPVLLDGCALLLQGEAAISADMLLSEGSVIIVEPNTILLVINTNFIEGGAIINTGTMNVSGEISFRTNVVNHNRWSLMPYSNVTLSNMYEQHTKNAILWLQHGSILSVQSGMLAVRRGLLLLDGQLDSSLQLSGVLSSSSEAITAWIVGDLILSPIATLRIHCDEFGSTCSSVDLTGVVYLRRSRLMLNVDQLADAVPIIRCNRTYGEFQKEYSNAYSVTYLSALIELEPRAPVATVGKVTSVFEFQPEIDSTTISHLEELSIPYSIVSTDAATNTYNLQNSSMIRHDNSTLLPQYNHYETLSEPLLWNMHPDQLKYFLLVVFCSIGILAIATTILGYREWRRHKTSRENCPPAIITTASVPNCDAANSNETTTNEQIHTTKREFPTFNYLGAEDSSE